MQGAKITASRSSRPRYKLRTNALRSLKGSVKSRKRKRLGDTKKMQKGRTELKGKPPAASSGFRGESATLLSFPPQPAHPVSLSERIWLRSLSPYLAPTMPASVDFIRTDCLIFFFGSSGLSCSPPSFLRFITFLRLI